jgi:preprotein translocase subunit SecG
MMTVVAIVHIIACLLLISLVLLQDPKSGNAGAMFGGGSNQLLSATGATTFLSRLTRISAIVFGTTCIVLTLLSRPNTGSVIDSMPAAAAPISAPPAAAPGAATTEKAPAEQAPAAPQPEQK